MADDEQRYIPLFRSPFLDEQPESRPQSHQSPIDKGDETLDHHISQQSADQEKAEQLQSQGLLPFRRKEKSANSELFYDLFFVANLTVFTFIHEVNDSETLRQHVGFFAILWFTWYNVAMYEIRFAEDSLIERAAKAIQFLVMIGYASIGPKFNVGEKVGDGDSEKPALKFYRAISLILMAGRLVLVIQYLQTLWFARRFKSTRLPLISIIAVYFVAAMTYLGLYFAFFGTDNSGENQSDIGWYIVGLFEVVSVSAISSYWKEISFKQTHLVERMSLLTLIILGEGVIAVARSAQTVIPSDGVFPFNAAIVAQIVCATLVLYFIYLIYFDWIREEHFGIRRQQFWAFVHFPLHLALVLAVEGNALSINWCAAVMRSDSLMKQFNKIDGELFSKHFKGDNLDSTEFKDRTHLKREEGSAPSAVEFEKSAKELNETAEELIVKRLEESEDIESTLSAFSDLIISRYDASKAISNGAEDSTTAENAFWWLWGTLFNSVFQIVGFVSSKPEEIGTAEIVNYAQDPYDFSKERDYYGIAKEDMNSAFAIYRLTYIYYFLCVGLVVMLSSLLASLSTKKKSPDHSIRLVVSSCVGLGLCLVTLVSVNEDALRSFTMSHWVLPTVALSLFIIVIINGVKPTRPKMLEMRRETRLDGA